MSPLLERAARATTAAGVLNALTIDVEDYYHVSAFEQCVDRARWDRRGHLREPLGRERTGTVAR